MSPRFFIDTNVFVYSVRETADYQPGSAAVVAALGAGNTHGVTSTAVIEELWHLELTGRIPELDGVTDAVFTLLRPVLSVTDDVMATAFELEVKGLGTNDRVHAATCQANDIPIIVSADRGFDGTPGLRRVDPADLSELRGLLAGVIS